MKLLSLLLENDKIINEVIQKHLVGNEYHLDDGWWDLDVTITDVVYIDDTFKIGVYVKGTVSLEDDTIGLYDHNVAELSDEIDEDWFVEEAVYDLYSIIAETFTLKYFNIGADL